MSVGHRFPLGSRLGHDFGRTPMGVEQVAAVACCGDPADCSERCAVVELCVCDPEFLALEVADLRCPTHGLAAVLRPALEATRGER